jgi:Transposase, Mutator family
MSEHLGYERHERSPSTNSRNGASSKTLHSDVGPVTIEVPRDRDSSFDPVIVPKHSRRLSGFDEQVLSLYAKGFTTQDIVDHVADIYGSKVSKDRCQYTPMNTSACTRYARYTSAGGYGRAPASNITGVSRSAETARDTARRSSASSPSVELTNTRRRRSGVRVTA